MLGKTSVTTEQHNEVMWKSCGLFATTSFQKRTKTQAEMDFQYILSALVGSRVAPTAEGDLLLEDQTPEFLKNRGQLQV